MPRRRPYMEPVGGGPQVAPQTPPPASTSTVTGLQPTGTSASAGYVSVIVDGTGFTPSTQITVNGTAINQTIYEGPTQVRTNYVQVPAAGTYQVGVVNPGEQPSNTKPFVVT